MGLSVRLVDRYIQIAGHRYGGPIILGIWLVLSVVGGIFIMPFIENLVSFYPPPSGTYSSNADAIYKKSFPEQANKVLNTVVIQNDNSSSNDVLTVGLREFSYGFRDVLMKKFPVIQQYYSYNTLMDESCQFTAKSLVSKDQRTTLIPIGYPLGQISFKDFVTFVQEQLDQHVPFGLKMSLTGMAAFYWDSIVVAQHDMEICDAVSLPVAMLVFSWVARSIPFAVLPLLSIGISVLTSFGVVMYLVAKAMDITVTCSSIMMSICIAMSIDYALFILTRMREEVQHQLTIDNDIDNLDVRRAVQQTLLHAGHTVFVSGSTLALCFLAIAFFPTADMHSIGLGGFLCVTVTMIASLSVLPIVLMLAPKLILRGIKPLHRTGDLGFSHVQSLTESFWYKLCSKVIKIKYIVVIVFIGLTIPLGFKAIGWKTTLKMEQYMPRGAPCMESYEIMREEFGEGFVYPFSLLIIPGDGDVMTQKFFNRTQTTLYTLSNEVKNTPITVFNGVVMNYGIPINLDMVEGFLKLPPENCSKTFYCSDLVKSYPSFVNGTREAMVVGISTSLDVFGDDGHQWILDFRDKIQQVAPDGDKYYLTGNTVLDNTDSYAEVYKVFPIIIIISGALVLVVVAASFKSIMVPLRAALTIALTVCWIYAFANLVYNDGVLDWLHITPLKGGGLTWTPPVVAFTCVVGLGLDYDVFLLTRVAELRDQGYSTEDSLMLAMAHTGRIISSAGLVMAIAFAGLMLSSMTVVNQMGFYLVVAVLIDTFLIRVVLVPAIISILGDLSWWPRKLPTVTLKCNSEERKSLVTNRMV